MTPSWTRALCWLAVGVSSITITLPAHASRTLVVAIGNNRGLPDQAELRYAERDATEFATVMQRLGGVAAEDLVLALGQDANALNSTLLELNARIRATAERDLVLLVYYSGHADARGLHLAGSTLPYKDLRAIVAGSAARMRVLVLDACRSGGMTRVKGLRAARDFQVRAEDRMQAEGLAIITSSAANEDSHESEQLRGSFFSHHLVTALRGAADRNQDQRVTLDEAYSYTYHQTLRSSGRTTQLQHPTFQYKLKGRGELVLTHLSTRGATGAELILAATGSYLIMQGSESGPVVAELQADKPNTRVLLAPGAYFVQRRGARAYDEYQVTLSSKRGLSLKGHPYRRVAYARLLRKGGGAANSIHSFSVLGGLRSTVLAGQGITPQALLGYSLELPWLSLSLRMRYAQSTFDHIGASLKTRQHELGLGLNVERYIDLEWLSLSMGLGVEGSWVKQQLSGPATGQDRQDAILSFGLFLALERIVYGPLRLRVEGGPLAYLLKRQKTLGGGPAGTTMETPLSWWLSAGLVWSVF